LIASKNGIDQEDTTQNDSKCQRHGGEIRCKNQQIKHTHKNQHHEYSPNQFKIQSFHILLKTSEREEKKTHAISILSSLTNSYAYFSPTSVACKQ
jgi:hypothetical protein